MLLKFDRDESNEEEEDGGETAKGSKAKKKPATNAGKSAKDAADGRIRLFVRLDFSDHEKLSHQRWLDRIPSEEPFKSVESEIIRPGESDFEDTEEHFNSLS